MVQIYQQIFSDSFDKPFAGAAVVKSFL